MGLNRAPEGRATPKEVYNYRIYLLTICVCLGSWMFGYNNGIIGGVLVLPSFYRDFSLPPVGTSSYNTITANIVSFLQIGGLCGAMATFPLMKKFGRRIALMVAAGIYTLGAALQVCFFLGIEEILVITKQTFSNGKLDMMYIARVITGLGTGSVTVIVPLVCFSPSTSPNLSC